MYPGIILSSPARPWEIMAVTSDEYVCPAFKAKYYFKVLKRRRTSNPDT
jgi:hypothetical protein